MAPRPTRIAVGSTNRTKVEAARAVAAAYFPGAAVVPVAVESGVRRQPMGQQETLEGARNRALRALEAIGADLGVGMEAGVAIYEQTGLLMGWCVAVDRQGREAAGCGLVIPLPSDVTAALLQGRELGDVVSERSGIPRVSQAMGTVGLLTRGYVTRRQTWEMAAAYALSPFLDGGVRSEVKERPSGQEVEGKADHVADRGDEGRRGDRGVDAEGPEQEG